MVGDSRSPGNFIVRSLELGRSCLERSPLSFLQNFILVLLLFLCQLLPLISPSLFPYAKYTLWNTHLMHGNQFPIDCAKWSLGFRSFVTSSQLILVYNNNNIFLLYPFTCAAYCCQTYFISILLYSYWDSRKFS